MYLNPNFFSYIPVWDEECRCGCFRELFGGQWTRRFPTAGTDEEVRFLTVSPVGAGLERPGKNLFHRCFQPGIVFCSRKEAVEKQDFLKNRFGV